MEERVLAIEMHIDPPGRSLHPNLLTLSKKNKGRQKKTKQNNNPQLFSPLRPITTINTTGPSLVPLPSSWSYFPFSISPLSLLTTLPLYQIWLSPVFAPLFSIFFFFIPGSNFPFPLIVLPPAHLSFTLSALHLLLSASLCTSYALCTQAQTVKNTLTHIHFSLSFPLLCSAHTGGSVTGD